MRIPHAPVNILIPKRVPMVRKSFVMEATAEPCKETKAPEKKPYRTHQQINPTVECVMEIQQKARMVAEAVVVARTFKGWK